MTPTPLRRPSVVDELSDALRDRILDGDLAAGAALREVELAEAYQVSRHTLRAALRALAGEGIVRLERNRGASVARLGRDELRWLFELRLALELEAAHLGLARNDGALPETVHAALARLTAACRRARPSWRVVATAHAALHAEIVRASLSPRIEAAYALLANEMSLFLLHLRPVWSLDRMVAHHERLLEELERDGPEALRAHLADGLAAVLDAPDA